jgi:hypothetical protein
MELMVVLLIFVAFGGLAWLAGAESRDGFADARVRQPRLPVR